MRYSSGQRGQTVNLLTLSSVVRIHVSPPLSSRSGSRLASVRDAGIAQLARASAFQAEGRGFEPRFPLHIWEPIFFLENYPKYFLLLELRPYSSGAEHFLGKEEVGGSNPLMGSSKVLDALNMTKKYFFVIIWSIF